MQLKIKIDLATDDTVVNLAQPAPFDPVKIRNFLVLLVILSSLMCTMAYSMWPTSNSQSAQMPMANSEIGILPIVDEDDTPPKQPDIITPQMVLLETIEEESPQISGETQQLEEIVVEAAATALPIKSDVVSRAQLTSAVAQREPIDNVTSLSLQQQKQLYFFTQINHFNDRVIYHRWLLNGKVMAQVKLSIGSDKWRTYSSKTFNRTMTGRWQAAVVDESEQVLFITEFDVTQ